MGRSHRGLQTGSDDALYSIEQGESLKSIVSRRGDEKVNTILRDKDIEDFRVCPKGQKVLVTRRNTVGGTYRVDDLYLLDRATDEMSRITRGARIREIDCGPHGRFAYDSIREGTRLVASRSAQHRICMPEVGRSTTRIRPMDCFRLRGDRNIVGRDLVLYDVSTGRTRASPKAHMLNSIPAFKTTARSFSPVTRTGSSNIASRFTL